jgi:hypothetical protein
LELPLEGGVADVELELSPELPQPAAVTAIAIAPMTA